MTPVVEAAGSRFGQNLIAAISSEGHMRYMAMQRFNADVFIKFLNQIVRTHNRPVIIATDVHRAHHSKKVKVYVNSEPRLLDIQLLPVYSP